MKLSPNEIRDITNLLEAGKPLPEKYRFVLFGEQRNVELLWDGKTNAVTDVNFPFQIIEQIDEPRSEKLSTLQFGLFDTSGRQLKGWSNKLIWGENKFILSSLKSGPLRDEIESNGGIKLIYIDPPFDVGANFKIDIEIGDETFEKEPNILEELAYRDTWGKGNDSFLSMIYERLRLMKDVLADDGVIVVHLDWRMNSLVRNILTEIFNNNFVNQITWQKIRTSKVREKGFPNVQDMLLVFSKSDSYTFNQVRVDFDPKYIASHYRADKKTGRLFRTVTLLQKRQGPSKRFGDQVINPPQGRHWIWSQERIDEEWSKGNIVINSSGNPEKIQWLDEMEGDVVGDIWTDIAPLNSMAIEAVGYPTQKPRELLERIIKAFSNENDIVADFFCGSGTTAEAAEVLGRKWIATDIGKFAIHTTKKRLITSQRALKNESKNWRAFELLNLGKYERGMLLSTFSGLDNDLDRNEQQRYKDKLFEKLILKAYKASELNGDSIFAGTKNNRLISVGPLNLPVTRLFVERVIEECRKLQSTKADILAFEFEMGLFPNIQDESRKLGVDLSFKYIPRDIFDKRAVDNGQVKFHDVAYIEVKTILKNNILQLELVDYSVGYQQDSIQIAEKELTKSGIRIVIDNGQVVKLEKNKDGIFTRTLLTKNWSDWIDYWSIDWDFSNRKEIVNYKNTVTGELETKWTGDFVFENEWQSFRTRKDRKIELKSIEKEMPIGLRKVAVKVVDIFGNDTMKIVEVKIGK
jgi:adenine-specific DNA-methyltransferase